MKKILFVLVIMALVLPVFAEDAKVLTQGVLRTYLAPSMSFSDSDFDSNGKKQSTNTSTYVNLGTALEYGINDWISAAVQWAPGYNVYSNIENSKQTSNGPFEAFVGAKVQVVGENAPAASDMFRVAFAPGVMVPLLYGYDAEKQTQELLAGNEYNVPPSYNVFAIGGRFYADYVINSSFFFNLYTQYKYFFPKNGDEDFSGFLMGADEVNYGYELTLELEPHYSAIVTEGVELSLGLPVTYTMTPEIKYDGTAMDNTDTQILDVTANIATFFTKLPLPLEIKVGYTYPAWGVNTSAMHSVVGQLKFYARF
jgi:hypothetical protein